MFMHCNFVYKLRLVLHLETVPHAAIQKLIVSSMWSRIFSSCFHMLGSLLYTDKQWKGTTEECCG